MLQEPIITALQLQMGHELNNSYVYKSMSAITDYQGLTGATKWFEKQSDEERGHFNKFFAYICDKGHVPTLPALNEILPQITSLNMLFDQVVMLEQNTLGMLQVLAQVAKECKDDQTYELILWFLKEQVEECKTVEDIQKRVSYSMNNMLLIDCELGERV